MNENLKVNVSTETLGPIITEQIREGKNVKIAPKGTSMLPLIREGKDTVTLTAIDKPLKKYDIAFYRRENGQYVLHRIVEIGDTIACIGDAQFVLEKGLQKEQFIGVVCEFSRGDKSHSIDGVGYKVYCRFWHLTRTLRYFTFRVFSKLKKILRR